MHSKALGIDFPPDLGSINDAVKLRNLLVHRNGKPLVERSSRPPQKRLEYLA